MIAMEEFITLLDRLERSHHSPALLSLICTRTTFATHHDRVFFLSLYMSFSWYVD